ncbi:myb/SANT-like DNA-binding domain-containing protein 3 [Sitophilus oryzae]|uniref:Regulatory protein zeste n=1 Tax=Sitophilus oryzae TaxID=7048 RepID=A0A6J2XJ99_SITOR|nr:myb/SANT-like DNA-binding domain-containing protein 3 [Sitophilus oryzae]
MSSASERTPYTNHEKLLLANLVDKYQLVLENKKTDASNLQQKQRAWDKIAAEYNAQATMITVRHTATQLKKLKRKANTEVKYQRLVTGGGPEPSESQDPVMEAVSVAAPHADVMMTCKWDMIGVYERQMAEEMSDATMQGYELVLEEGEEPEDIYPSTSGLSIKKMVDATPKTTTFTADRPLCAAKQTASGTGRQGRTAQKEADIRMRKVEESIQQQLQLRSIRQKIEEENLQAAVLRKKVEEENLRTATASRKKAEIEADLAMLHMQLFKNKNI